MSRPLAVGEWVRFLLPEPCLVNGWPLGKGLELWGLVVRDTSSELRDEGTVWVRTPLSLPSGGNGLGRGGTFVVAEADCERGTWTPWEWTPTLDTDPSCGTPTHDGTDPASSDQREDGTT